MSNVISFAGHRVDASRIEEPARWGVSAEADTEESAETSCIRGAAALAEACADWSLILLHHPSREAMALLAEARLLIRDLLVVGGIAPPHAGALPASTPRELELRIRHLKESALALGAIVQPPL